MLFYLKPSFVALFAERNLETLREGLRMALLFMYPRNHRVVSAR